MLASIWQFVCRRLNSRLFVFLFCLVLSSVFWLMMTLNEVYEREIPIPMELTGVPKSVVITTDLDDTLRVIVRDKGYALATYLYGRGLGPIRVGFASHANRKTGVGTVTQTELKSMAAACLDGSSTVVSIKNEQRNFYFNNGDSKRVPVRLTGSVATRQNYYLSRTALSPDSVTVYASLALLDSIDYIESEPLNVTDLSDTLHLTVGLEKRAGVKCSPASISVHFYADVLTQQEAEVPIRAVNMAEGKTLRTFPSRVKVRYTVGAALSRSIKTSQFVVVADYHEIATNPQSKCRLHLTGKPAGVKSASLVTDEVDYLIEQQ